MKETETKPGRGRVGMVVVLLVLALGGFAIYSLYGAKHAEARETGRELDVAIFGRGHLEVYHERSGKTCFTRLGRLSINPDGYLCVGNSRNNWMVEPNIWIPVEARDVRFGPDGIVSYQDSSTTPSETGQLQLCLFQNNDGLREVLPGIYEETEESGMATMVSPGNSGAGLIKQEWLLRDQHEGMFDPRSLLMGAVLFLLAWILLEVRKLRREIGSRLLS